MCLAELRAVEYRHIRLVAEAKTTFLQVYQCDTCGQWYDIDLSGRICQRDERHARASLRDIEAGL
ncbi:hypothetical protein [Demequina sp. NBRC 110055]|uniref:hypothetical protein n=1 Tax=Demequina sp. NBRC 110055 TaxID=1570344 RepID=UPI000A060260|nr:hypothetical protein [Demequina sp. NBRC 110055]